MIFAADTDEELILKELHNPFSPQVPRNDWLALDAVNSGEFFALTTSLLPLALINIDDVGSRYDLRRDDVIWWWLYVRGERFGWCE